MYPNLNKLKLQKRVEGIQNLKYNNILEKSFISLIVGKPGSGKSTLIEQFLLNPDLYYRKFDFLFILSPSSFQNMELDDSNSTKQFDLQWLCQKLLDVKKLNLQRKFNMLIIFDDMISQIKQNYSDRVLMDLFFNRRNIITNCTISIMLTTQKFNVCPCDLRQVLTSLYIFDVSMMEWEIIRKEQMKIDSKELKQLVSKTFVSEKNHDFLYVKMRPFQIYHNFKPVQLKSQFKSIQQQLYDGVNTDNEDNGDDSGDEQNINDDRPDYTNELVDQNKKIKGVINSNIQKQLPNVKQVKQIQKQSNFIDNLEYQVYKHNKNYDEQLRQQQPQNTNDYNEPSTKSVSNDLTQTTVSSVTPQPVVQNIVQTPVIQQPENELLKQLNRRKQDKQFF